MGLSTLNWNGMEWRKENDLITLSTNSKSKSSFFFFAKQSLAKIDNANIAQMKFIMNAHKFQFHLKKIAIFICLSLNSANYLPRNRNVFGFFCFHCKFSVPIIILKLFADGSFFSCCSQVVSKHSNANKPISELIRNAHTNWI